MNLRLLSPLLVAVLILASGCSTPRPTTPELRTQPGFEPARAPSTEQLSVVGAEVRNTKIFVDIVAMAIGETVNGLPVLNVAHATEAGNAAKAALQAEFVSRGFRASSTELTSMGLGGPSTRIMLTQGHDAPVPSQLPVMISSNLADTPRGSWLTSLYGAVYTFASGGTTPATLAATYLSPNQNRIEVFVVLSGGGGSRAQIWAAAFDSRTGHVLWSGSASESTSILDASVATSLVRSLARSLPALP